MCSDVDEHIEKWSKIKVDETQLDQYNPLPQYAICKKEVRKSFVTFSNNDGIMVEQTDIDIALASKTDKVSTFEKTSDYMAFRTISFEQYDKDVITCWQQSSNELNSLVEKIKENNSTFIGGYPSWVKYVSHFCSVPGAVQCE